MSGLQEGVQYHITVVPVYKNGMVGQRSNSVLATMHKGEDIKKCPQKVWNIMLTIIFLDIFGNEVYCIVYHCKTLSALQ